MNLREKNKRKHLLNWNMMYHIDREKKSKLPWRNSQNRQYEEQKTLLLHFFIIIILLEHSVFI